MSFKVPFSPHQLFWFVCCYFLEKLLKKVKNVVSRLTSLYAVLFLVFFMISFFTKLTQYCDHFIVNLFSFFQHQSINTTCKIFSTKAIRPKIKRETKFRYILERPSILGITDSVPFRAIWPYSMMFLLYKYIKML